MRLLGCSELFPGRCFSVSKVNFKTNSLQNNKLKMLIGFDHRPQLVMLDLVNNHTVLLKKSAFQIHYSNQ